LFSYGKQFACGSALAKSSHAHMYKELRTFLKETPNERLQKYFLADSIIHDAKAPKAVLGKAKSGKSGQWPGFQRLTFKWIEDFEAAWGLSGKYHIS
jgi:hypothetical protein